MMILLWVDDASAATFAMIRTCIKAVLTEDERIDMKDEAR